jgi:UTP-glucose-1-phosphate uridylyltransferase
MTVCNASKVVIAAGGLGTRVACWARFIPKEFYPVNGRPGIVHLLEEIGSLGPAQVVIGYHPYYEGFATWARHVLSERSQARYAGGDEYADGAVVTPTISISFVPQHGPYADITSVVNGFDHLAAPAHIYIAFADNLYGHPGPLRALRGTAPGHVVVLASRYQREQASRCGVIIARRYLGQCRMAGLVEKPSPAKAEELERRYGRSNLLLLEGRARLTSDFVCFARNHISDVGPEPKLALALGAYATAHPVYIAETESAAIDLGALAANSREVPLPLSPIDSADGADTQARDGCLPRRGPKGRGVGRMLPARMRPRSSYQPILAHAPRLAAIDASGL